MAGKPNCLRAEFLEFFSAQKIKKHEVKLVAFHMRISKELVDGIFAN
jgi:hypothetical protein